MTTLIDLQDPRTPEERILDDVEWAFCKLASDFQQGVNTLSPREWVGRKDAIRPYLDILNQVFVAVEAEAQHQESLYAL